MVNKFKKIFKDYKRAVDWQYFLTFLVLFNIAAQVPNFTDNQPLIEYVKSFLYVNATGFVFSIAVYFYAKRNN